MSNTNTTTSVYDYLASKWVQVLSSSNLVRITTTEQQQHILTVAQPSPYTYQVKGI